MAYTIKKGDTLSKLASQNGTTVEELMRRNPSIKDPNKIYAGATLNLPTVTPKSTQKYGPATPSVIVNQTTPPKGGMASSFSQQFQKITGLTPVEKGLPQTSSINSTQNTNLSLSSGAGSNQSPSLPQTPSSGNQLLDFKNALDFAVNSARQKRGSLNMDFMKPFSGTVAASDFNSILGNLNRASDNFSSDLIENTEEVYKDQAKAMSKAGVQSDKPLSLLDLTRVQDLYGIVPPPGTTVAQLEQLIQDNPNTPPEELQEALNKFMVSTDGADAPSKNSEQYLSIPYFLKNFDVKTLKGLSDKAGTSKWYTGKKTDVNRFLVETMKKVEAAREQGYNDDEILEYLGVEQ